MKVRGGRLKKNIKVKAGAWDYVEIPVREGTRIALNAAEVDGDNFKVYIVRAGDVKRTPLVGTITEFNDDKALWASRRSSRVNHEYTAGERDTLFVLFDNCRPMAVDFDESIDIDIEVDHPPLIVGDEPLRESFEVDAGWMETIDVEASSGDTIRVFGRVTKGNDITVHVLAQIYETPDSIHTDKAYFTKEKVGEIDITYQCPKTEPLLIVFDNGYSLRTTKTIDVSVQVLKGEKAPTGRGICKYCQARIDEDAAFCPHCGGKQ